MGGSRIWSLEGSKNDVATALGTMLTKLVVEISIGRLAKCGDCSWMRR